MSVIETCAAVAIAASAVFFAAPSLIRSRDNYQLDQVTRQVAGHMQWTRIKAISRDQDCRFRIVSAASYVVECKGSVWLQDEAVGLPAGFRITSTATPVFHKRGNASPAATITIWDKRFNSKSAVVNITGRVRVQ